MAGRKVNNNLLFSARVRHFPKPTCINTANESDKERNICTCSASIYLHSPLCWFSLLSDCLFDDNDIFNCISIHLITHFRMPSQFHIISTGTSTSISTTCGHFLSYFTAPLWPLVPVFLCFLSSDHKRNSGGDSGIVVGVALRHRSNIQCDE